MKKIQKTVKRGKSFIYWARKTARKIPVFIKTVMLIKVAVFIETAMMKRNRSACWMNIATLLAGLAAFEVYRSLSLADARYEGKTMLYHFANCAPLVICLVIVWEFICLVGLERWGKILTGIRRGSKKVWESRGWKCAVGMAATAALAGVLYSLFVNQCETEYYSEITEFFGIPEGVGNSLSEEEREGRAGYWRLDNYPRKHRLVLTYVDAYGQPELMREYSSAYNMMFFQPVARIEYYYKENKNKFHAYGKEIYNRAGERNFREPEKIIYYASNGQVLMELSGAGDEKLKVESYASEKGVQLSGSTLFRVPEGQTAGSSVTSWQLECRYDTDGRPLERKLGAGVCNLYGINGERYTYDDQRRLVSLCYLDENGISSCNKEGIMLITFRYDEDGSREIAYYSDENGTERTEGYHGVYCEELTYDAKGNLTKRRQKDKQGRWCCDDNGVYQYIYRYEGGRLKSEAYFGVDEEPVRIRGWDSRMIFFSQEKENGTQIVKVFLDRKVIPVISAVLNAMSFPHFPDGSFIKTVFFENRDPESGTGETGRNLLFLQAVNNNGVREAGNFFFTGYQEERDRKENSEDSREKNQEGKSENGWEDVQEGRTESIRENNWIENPGDSQEESREGRAGGDWTENDPEDSTGWNGADKQAGESGDPDSAEESDGERKRSYTRIENIITKNALQQKFYGRDAESVIKELGYAQKKILYDENMRVKEVAYLDQDGEACSGREGYAIKRIGYQSKDNDKVKIIEYLDAGGKRTMNTEKGYSYVRYQYGRQGEGEVITSQYFDSEDDPVYLSQGYAAVDRVYNKSGFLIQVTYRDKNNIITCRNDYGVAEILYEYGDDGNLSRVWYKDTNEKPVNRLDTGYAVIYQEYRAGQLVRRHYEGYRDGTLCPVPDRTTGVYDVEYQYIKGKLCRKRYFDGDGRPVLSSDLGCAEESYEYDDNGKIIRRCYYGTDGKLILRKDTGYAVMRYEYNEEEQYEIYWYLDAEEKPVIHLKKHCAGIRQRYEEDRLVEIQYLDLDGNLMNRSDYGVARIVRTYNKNGKQETEEYYDAEHKHAVYKGYGYARAEYFYDEKDRLKECRYYDFPEGRKELTARGDTGYAIIRYEYDDKGNRTSQTYFDTDEKPVVHMKYHCAGILSEYDEYGNEIVTGYVDGDGSLMERDDYGFAWVSREYNPKTGKLLKESFFDRNHLPAVWKGYGYSSYELRYDERGNHVETRYYDAKDRLTLRDDTGYAAVYYKYNEYGLLKEQRFLDKEGNPVIGTDYHCAGISYDYDLLGRQKQITYMGLDGEPADRSDYGCAIVQKHYDDAGRVIGENYLKADKTPAIRRDQGYASFKCVYKDGRLRQKLYYGLNKELVPDRNTGYAMEEWEYDEYGNMVLWSFYGVDRKPVISSKYECAGIKYFYPHKNTREIWYLGLDGKPMIRGDYGCAGILKEFDGFGNLVKESYRNLDEKLIVRKDLGYAYFEADYDRKTGRWTGSRFKDAQGALTLQKAHGYAAIQVEYDDRGREKRFTYYGKNEEAIITSGYCCAGMEYFYDETGNLKKIRYLSPDGSLMTRRDLGYAQVEKEYNKSGRLIGENYFDTEGNPAVRKERGYASYRERYSPGGLLLECRYFGLDGKQVLRQDMGYAAVQYEYDDYGRRVASRFSGTDLKPVISTEYNCAAMVSRYEDGNEVETRYLGLDNEPMNRRDYGCAQIRREYDKFGLLRKVTYLDAEEKEVLRRNLGYARCEKEYDPYHRWIEDRFYDDYGDLTLNWDTGTAIVRLEWDEYGREKRYGYYGKKEEPVLNKKYYCYGMEYFYDILGNREKIQYLDSEGSMMVREDYGCMQVLQEFDAWGQVIKESYCNKDEKPVRRTKYGYGSRVTEYEQDREQKILYLDPEGDPVERADTGYAMIRYTYDERGQRASVSYYDAGERQVIPEGYGCAGYRYWYDERGNRTYTWFLGPDDGEEFIHENYGAMVNYRVYDEYDRIIWDTYYHYHNSEYQPVIRKDTEYFAVRYTYNEQGQTEKEEYLGTEYELVMHKEYGYAECRWIYNDLGQLEYIRYYDTEGNPVNRPEGYAEIQYIYDASGNDVDWKYRKSSDLSPIPGSGGLGF